MDQQARAERMVGGTEIDSQDKEVTGVIHHHVFYLDVRRQVHNKAIATVRSENHNTEKAVGWLFPEGQIRAVPRDVKIPAPISGYLWPKLPFAEFPGEISQEYVDIATRRLADHLEDEKIFA